MECKSVASSSMTRRYDVFVSFRGEDVRNSFVDNLFAAFQRKGIVAFKDDTNIKQGDHISTELMEAIEGSQVLIVVFSKNYANSSWCLQELAKIVDCMKREVPTGQRQVVMPVFYDVSPSEVRKQSGDYYGKAFAEHQDRFKHDLGMVQRWRDSLLEVANLSGSDIQNKLQFKETEKIVKRVMSILGNKFCYLPNNDLVGMQSHMDELEKFLALDSQDDVQVVGIWGMGGIGKTTLAQVLFYRISHQYDARCFVDDVSKIYQGHGPLGVHKQLYGQVLNEDNQEVWSLSKATYLTTTILSRVKAFIVLDNVDDVKQLEGLAVNRELLCAGSKIIVVSRNKHIFEQFGVNKVYQVQCLNEDDALQLFCRKAFRSDYIIREYEELTCRALEYAQGHPLAIKTLGSFLLGRNISEWISALNRLRDNPERDIIDVLRVSFDGLEQSEKEIFLDIACFFNYNSEKDVKRILNYFGFHPEIGIRVLIDQSLIKNLHGKISMHDMLVELGKKIVREKAPNDPRKWSRIWRNKDFQNIILDQTTMGDLEAIQLLGRYNDERWNQKETLRAEVLSAMSHLRLLIVDGTNFSGSLDCLSNKLQYLKWYEYPFTYLPSSFEPIQLFELILPCSKIKRLWEDTKHLHHLRIMDLRCSENLIKTPDFRGLTNLEELDLEGCTKLVEIHPSIGLLKKLRVLNLRNCTSLKSLPYSVFSLSSLEVLNLSGCSKVFNSQLLGNGRHAEHLKKLDVSEAAMKCKSTSSVLKKFSFQFFSSAKKNKIVGLLLPSFQCLQELNLYKCNLHSIPDAIGSLHGLEKLNLGGNNFVTLPSSMKELPRLKCLYLAHCKQLKYLPYLTISTDLPTTTRTRIIETEFVYDENRLPGLYIFNCPKLIGAESWSNIVLSWMIQFLKIHHKPWPGHGTVHCVVPGSQVPMWFDNSEGNTIILADRDWIGLALCAAFVVPAENHSTFWYESTGYYPLQFSLRWGRTTYVRLLPVFIEKGLVVKVESDHILLLYLPREALIYDTTDEYDDLLDCNKREVSLYFSNSSVPRDRLVVKKWGFRGVFKQDLELEELTPTMSHLSLEPQHVG